MTGSYHSKPINEIHRSLRKVVLDTIEQGSHPPNKIVDALVAVLIEVICNEANNPPGIVKKVSRQIEDAFDRVQS